MCRCNHIADYSGRSHLLFSLQSPTLRLPRLSVYQTRAMHLYRLLRSCHSGLNCAFRSFTSFDLHPGGGVYHFAVRFHQNTQVVEDPVSKIANPYCSEIVLRLSQALSMPF